jgi:lipopolysaccharide export system permease protein
LSPKAFSFVKIIGKYVLKEHVGPFLFASTALTSLMLLQYIAKRLGELVGKGLPVSVILEFLLLSLPFTIAMTLPMAVLVAVLYAFSRLAAESEINAMKASGVSMWTVLSPVLLAGFAMSVFMLGFNDQVLSRSNHRLATLQLDIFRTKPTFALKDQVMNAVKEGQLYLRAADIENDGRMRQVVIYDLADPSRRRTIYADSGTLAMSSNGRDLDMMLYDGEMLTVPNKKPAELTRLFFEKDRLRVKNIFNSYQESQAGSVSKSDREMTICEMQSMVARADFALLQAKHDSAIVAWEGRGAAEADRPARPTAGRGTGIAAAYCKMLAFVSVKSANAQTPGNPQQPAKVQAPDTVPTTRGLDSAMVAARIQEAGVREHEARRERNRYDVEIQKKFSLAAACMIFVLIGAPIALRFPRGGVGLVIGVSFGIFGLYYVGLIGGETLADKALLPPWLAMWAANIILAGIGIILAVRMGRESSTSRGGDFGEMMLLARAKTLGWARRFGVNVERRRK